MTGGFLGGGFGIVSVRQVCELSFVSLGAAVSHDVMQS